MVQVEELSAMAWAPRGAQHLLLGTSRGGILCLDGVLHSFQVGSCRRYLLPSPQQLSLRPLILPQRAGRKGCRRSGCSTLRLKPLLRAVCSGGGQLGAQ